MIISAPRKKIINKIIFLIAIFLFFPISSFAQQSSIDSYGLTAIPPRLEVEVKPDTTTTNTIKVRNESSTEKLVSIEIRDIIVNNDKGTPVELDSNQIDNRWAASQWIQVSPTQLRLRPGETKGVQIITLTPADALPGGHYALIKYVPVVPQDQNGSLVTPSVGTLVYITIPGDIKKDATISLFKAPKFLEFGPIDFKTTITNLSDIHITPIGKIVITNLFGKKSHQINLPQTNIFPLASFSYQNTWDKKWLLGKFKATLEATYTDNGHFLEATAFFWVIPWRLILLILILITLLVILYKVVRNHSKQEEQTNQNNSDTIS